MTAGPEAELRVAAEHTPDIQRKGEARQANLALPRARFPETSKRAPSRMTDPESLGGAVRLRPAPLPLAALDSWAPPPDSDAACSASGRTDHCRPAPPVPATCETAFPADHLARRQAGERRGGPTDGSRAQPTQPRSAAECWKREAAASAFGFRHARQASGTCVNTTFPEKSVGSPETSVGSPSSFASLSTSPMSPVTPLSDVAADKSVAPVFPSVFQVHPDADTLSPLEEDNPGWECFRRSWLSSDADRISHRRQSSWRTISGSLASSLWSRQDGWWSTEDESEAESSGHDAAAVTGYPRRMSVARSLPASVPIRTILSSQQNSRTLGAPGTELVLTSLPTEDSISAVAESPKVVPSDVRAKSDASRPADIDPRSGKPSKLGSVNTSSARPRPPRRIRSAQELFATVGRALCIRRSKSADAAALRDANDIGDHSRRQDEGRRPKDGSKAQRKPKPALERYFGGIASLDAAGAWLGRKAPDGRVQSRSRSLSIGGDIVERQYLSSNADFFSEFANKRTSPYLATQGSSSEVSRAAEVPMVPGPIQQRNAVVSKGNCAPGQNNTKGLFPKRPLIQVAHGSNLSGSSFAKNKWWILADWELEGMSDGEPEVVGLCNVGPSPHGDERNASSTGGRLRRQSSPAAACGGENAGQFHVDISALSHRERMRQEAIFELIATERDYVRDLKLVSKVKSISAASAFYRVFSSRIVATALSRCVTESFSQWYIRGIRKQNLMDEQSIQLVFTNIESILSLNEELLSALEKRRRAGKGIIKELADIFLDMVSTAFSRDNASATPAPFFYLADSFPQARHFKVYNMYCSNYTRALEHLADLLNPSVRSPAARSRRGSAAGERASVLASFLDATAAQPCMRNLDLRAYLLLPIQRVCRYPLLLKQILKHTSEDGREYDTPGGAGGEAGAGVVAKGEAERGFGASADSERFRMERAVEVATAVVDSVNESSRFVEEMKRTVRLSETIRIDEVIGVDFGEPSALSLVWVTHFTRVYISSPSQSVLPPDSSRRIIHQGTVHKVSTLAGSSSSRRVLSAPPNCCEAMFTGNAHGSGPAEHPYLPRQVSRSSHVPTDSWSSGEWSFRPLVSPTTTTTFGSSQSNYRLSRRAAILFSDCLVLAKPRSRILFPASARGTNSRGAKLVARDVLQLAEYGVRDLPDTQELQNAFELYPVGRAPPRTEGAACRPDPLPGTAPGSTWTSPPSSPAVLGAGDAAAPSVAFPKPFLGVLSGFGRTHSNADYVLVAPGAAARPPAPPACHRRCRSFAASACSASPAGGAVAGPLILCAPSAAEKAAWLAHITSAARAPRTGNR
ncbi:MAG: hypothetical protein BJ554DRAFT_4461 [Olpidium bornovanus]|uniref:DH domain-containing protein n=1 Tax=Olpidium bornovanus TaxID=278681 RepID=A0A8H7ZM80_9FUNG|nr:MAG: hypothetical protein BJ554DRAFT_4461 [Olpidium bornovanus]